MNIEFFLDGSLHAAREWPVVPRWNEIVVLSDGIYVVKNVAYHSARVGELNVVVQVEKGE